MPHTQFSEKENENKKIFRFQVALNKLYIMPEIAFRIISNILSEMGIKIKPLDLIIYHIL